MLLTQNLNIKVSPLEHFRGLYLKNQGLTDKDKDITAGV